VWSDFYSVFLLLREIMVEPEYASSDVKPSQPIVVARSNTIHFDLGTKKTWAVSLQDNSYIHLYTVSDHGNSVTHSRVVTIYRNNPEWPLTTDGKPFEEFARNLVRKYVGLGQS
jgi:hypothetical protein